MDMIDIPFDPNLTILGPFTLSWHGIFSVIGIVFGVWLPVRLVGGRVSESTANTVATWGVVGGLIGARLFHVIDQWETRYAQDPLAVIAIWNGGIAIVGAMVGGIAGGFLRAVLLNRRAVGQRPPVPIGYTADAAAPGLGLGMAIGRIGDIINGEHHATSCSDLPWCVRYTHPNTLGQHDYVHPAVAYEMVFDLALVALLLWLRRFQVGRPGEGRLMWLFLGLYGVGRFFISFLRVEEVRTIAGLWQAQLLSLGLIAASAIMLGYLSAPAPARASKRF